MNIFNLIATLVLDSSNYESGLKKSEKSTSNFAGKAKTAFKGVASVVGAIVTAVVAAATALSKLTTEAINFADEIDKTSQKLGLSAESYQTWSLAAQMAGTEVSTLQMGIRNLNTFIEKLNAGNSDASKTLNKLGIDFKEFSTMNMDDKLMSVVNALQGVTDAEEKARLAQDIFGSRSYMELLPLLNQEQGSVAELADEYNRLGIIISDDIVKDGAKLNDQITVMKAQIKSLTTIMVSELFPAVKKIISAITAIITGSSDAEEAVNNLIDGISDIINKATEILPDLIDKVGSVLIKVIEGTTSKIPQMVPALVKVIEKLIVALIDSLPSIVGSFGEIIAALIEGILSWDWGNLISHLLDAILNILLVQLPDIIDNIINIIFDLFTGEKGVSMLVKLGGKIIEAVLNGIIRGFTAGINLIIKAINLLTKGISQIWTWAGVPEIPAIPEIEIPYISFFAKGGILDDAINGYGTIYAAAGEGKPEVVAQGSRGTGVATMEQLSDSVYDAIDRFFGHGIAVTLRVGDKDFDAYLLKSINNTLRGQGRQTLDKLTRW